jgi:hypothetical protein
VFPSTLFPAAIFPPPLYPGTGKGASVPIVVPIEPNPAETVWLLGPDGAVVTLRATPGFAITWDTTLLNNGVGVPFDPADTLDARVWRGQQEVSLFAPGVEWIDATLGTLSMSISANQTTTLDKGTYRIQVGVTHAGTRVLAYDGTLELADTVGSVAVPQAWCTYEDMLDRSTVLQSLDSRKVDITGFLNLRAIVTSELIDDIVERLEPRPGMVKVRRNIPHPIVGIDVADPNAVPPSKADVRSALEAGQVVFRKRLIEIVARRTIALVMSRQSTSDQRYRQEAMDQRAMADDLWRKYQAQVLLGGTSYSQASSYPQALVDMDVVLLPPGVAA